jgi:hypothetical protein
MKLAVFGLVALTFLNGCGDEGEVGQLGDASGGRDGLMELSLAVQALSPELIYEPPVPLSATDLDFNPEREGELWITLRPHYDESLLCTEESESVGACQQLEGRVVIVEDATGRDLQTQELSARVAQDPNGWHFLRRPPAIAFGPDNTFGTCGEARTGNFEDTDPDYIGPTLWSSDPQIFAQLVSQGANGSHIDMLHSSPFCVGIAHDVDNVYWVFNGQQGSVDRYDFNEPHEPGGEDHSDGELLRYVDGSLSRVPSVPGHMVIDGDARCGMP